MNSQKVEQSLRQILDKCGEEIIHNHNRFQSAVFDLLDKINDSDERLILKHAMDSNAFWILLETTQITADSAKKAMEQIQKESRMTRDDAEFVVRCVTAVRGDTNILMEDCHCPHTFDHSSGTVFGSKISRDSIISVTFMNSLKLMPNTAWDVSWKQDSSVMAWTERSNRNGKMLDLFIGAEGSIKGRNCRGLFAHYKNAEIIDFNHCFDTSQVTDMREMFCGCSSLKELDVSGFDTSQVIIMMGMFRRCLSLKELDVSGFATSQVINMGWMFCSCSSLKELDVSGFDTSQVTDMNYMFSFCSSLTELDVSGFATSQVENMEAMFYNCSSLKELDVSGFDTSQVRDIERMFYNCSSLKGLDESGYDIIQVRDAEHTIDFSDNEEWKPEEWKLFEKLFE